MRNRTLGTCEHCGNKWGLTIALGKVLCKGCALRVRQQVRRELANVEGKG